jgi:NADPH-dependent curcumin reductase CurA
MDTAKHLYAESKDKIIEQMRGSYAKKMKKYVHKGYDMLIEFVGDIILDLEALAPRRLICSIKTLDEYMYKFGNSKLKVLLVYRPLVKYLLTELCHRFTKGDVAVETFIRMVNIIGEIK